MPTQKHNNTCFGTLYILQKQDLNQLCVMKSMVTYFILQVHTKTGVSHS